MTEQPAVRPSSASPGASSWALDLVLALAAVGGVVAAVVLSGFIFLTAAFSDSANGLAGGAGWFVLDALLGIGLPVLCLVVGARGMRTRAAGPGRGWAVAALVVGVATTAVGLLVVGAVSFMLLPVAFQPA